jgi:hypothetical protein
MPATTTKGNVPAPAEAKAKTEEVVFQRDLAERTLVRLSIEAFPDAEIIPNSEKALPILREAFKEANCNYSLFACDLLDLAGNKRLRGQDNTGQGVIIPCEDLPPVGTVISYNNLTYYIAEHRPEAKA